MVATLPLLGNLGPVTVGKVTQLVLSCMNFNDRLGCGLGSESHAGKLCCCTGFLVISSQLYQVDSDLFVGGFELASGGLSGRLEVTSCDTVCGGFGPLRIRGRLHWVDREKLRSAISRSRVMVRRLQVLWIGQEVDPFHILLGTAVLEG